MSNERSPLKDRLRTLIPDRSRLGSDSEHISTAVSATPDPVRSIVTAIPIDNRSPSAIFQTTPIDDLTGGLDSDSKCILTPDPSLVIQSNRSIPTIEPIVSPSPVVSQQPNISGLPSSSAQVTNSGSGTNTNERAGLSQSHPFIESRRLVITDGQFNQIRGHHTNLVINFNQSTSASPPGSPSGSLPSNETSHINPGPFFGQSTQHNQAEVSSQSQQILLQKSNDIYERHLTPKGRGFPLWIPEPNRLLHIGYRRTGIRIGDVGIITHSGGFSFLFNICLPHDDPVNPRMLPEHFAPISPPIEATDIEEFLVFKNGSHLASASIKISQSSADISGIVFESSASEGAILTMPRGARSEDLGNFARFREYAAANVAHWYKFVNGPRGREAKNGDVRLVVGFDKTTSWGIATFANQTQQNNCRLRFGPAEGGLTSTYAWEYSGIADVRAGPDSNEHDELRRDSDPLGVQFENQCLFVRTLNATLADDIWADIHSSLGSVHINPRNSQYSDSNHPHPSNPSTGSGSNSLPSEGAHSGTVRTTRATGSLYGLQDVDTSVFISGPSQSLTDHPSKLLNDILLTKVPTAKMAITHDNDWSSVITQEQDTLPDPHEFVANILAVRNICEENGVIFLQSKEIPNKMLEVSASASPVQVSEVIMTHLAETDDVPFDEIFSTTAASNDLLSWTNQDSRESILFNSWGILYRFQTTTSPNGLSVTTMWRAIRPNKEDRIAKLEWAPNGGLGRVVMGKHTSRMVDLARPDPSIYGARGFIGPDDLQYRWQPSTTSVDVVLRDPNGEIIAFFRPTRQTRYQLGDVYGELHFLRNAGMGTVTHPPIMDMVTLTAMLYRFCATWNV